MWPWCKGASQFNVSACFLTTNIYWECDSRQNKRSLHLAFCKMTLPLIVALFLVRAWATIYWLSVRELEEHLLKADESSGPSCRQYHVWRQGSFCQPDEALLTVGRGLDFCFCCALLQFIDCTVIHGSPVRGTEYLAEDFWMNFWLCIDTFLT